MVIHIVRSGETVYSIAGRYGVDPALLMEANGINADGALAVGQALVIQTVRTFHVVRAGQTLLSIARAYGLSLRQLYRNNYALMGQPALHPGQRLVIAYEGEKLGRTVTDGYAYPFIQPRELSATLPYVSWLTPFTYGISAQGSLLPLDDGRLIAEAVRMGSAPVMHLSTLTEEDQFSGQRAVRVLTDAGLRAALIGQIEATILEKNYQGLDVDFEYIPAAMREAYPAFIREVRAKLSPHNLPVTVALAPKTYAGQPGLLYEGHDYALLGAAADYVLLMTYEWGYAYGPPMAVSPLPNVRQVVEYALSEMPADKIFLGISNYGYDWPLPFVQDRTRARSLSNQEAVAIAVAQGAVIQYDEAAQSPYFRYTRDGAVHEVWFEDARSMAAKLRLIAEYGLHGAGYWNLMRPYPQGWTVLNALYNVEDAGSSI